MRYYVYGYRGAEEFFGLVVRSDEVQGLVQQRSADGWNVIVRPVEQVLEEA